MILLSRRFGASFRNNPLLVIKWLRKEHYMVKIERIAASWVRIWSIIAGSTATVHGTPLACLSRTIEITIHIRLIPCACECECETSRMESIRGSTPSDSP